MIIKTIIEAQQFDISNHYKKQTFEVFGEDQSNGGMYDRANIPMLGYFRGTAEEVLEYAFTLKKWESWGSGGKLKVYTPPIINNVDSDSIQKLITKRNKLAELNKQKTDLEIEIKELEK